MKRKLCSVSLPFLLMAPVLGSAAKPCVNNCIPPPQRTPMSGVSSQSAFSSPEYLEQYTIPEGCKPLQLPAPGPTVIPVKQLSLKDAILLAIRNNPDVRNAELTRITDKYALQIAHYAFEPVYQFGGNATYTSGEFPRYSLNPVSVSVKTPAGLVSTLNYSNNFDEKGGSVVATFQQPLLKGFGYVNRIPYLNALDTEEVAKLTFKAGVIGVVTTVITNYYNLVQVYNSLDVTRRSLTLQEDLNRQNLLKVKVGKLAPSDLLQQQANLEANRVAYLQQLDILQQNYQTFLTSLGLLPNAKLNIDRKLVFQQYELPTREKAICIALANNTQYLSSVIQMRATYRNILTQQDAMKPELTATATENLTGLGTTHREEKESLVVNFNVPIDNFQAKVNLVNARVAWEQAKISLEQSKEALLTNVITQLASIRSLARQVTTSETAVRLQEITLKNTLIRQQYGKATMFEVVQTQNDLLAQQINLIAAQIAYQNGIAQFQQLLGVTLEEWHIRMRY